MSIIIYYYLIIYFKFIINIQDSLSNITDNENIPNNNNQSQSNYIYIKIVKIIFHLFIYILKLLSLKYIHRNNLYKTHKILFHLLEQKVYNKVWYRSYGKIIIIKKIK